MLAAGFLVFSFSASLSTDAHVHLLNTLFWECGGREECVITTSQNLPSVQSQPSSYTLVLGPSPSTEDSFDETPPHQGAEWDPEKAAATLARSQFQRRWTSHFGLVANPPNCSLSTCSSVTSHHAYVTYYWTTWPIRMILANVTSANQIELIQSSTYNVMTSQRE